MAKHEYDISPGSKELSPRSAFQWASLKVDDPTGTTRRSKHELFYSKKPPFMTSSPHFCFRKTIRSLSKSSRSKMKAQTFENGMLLFRKIIGSISNVVNSK